MTRRLIACLGIGLLCMGLASCKSAPKKEAEPTVPEVVSDFDAELDELVDGTPPADPKARKASCLDAAPYPFRVDSITPAEGSRDRTNLLTIEGRGFTDGGGVKIGGSACDEVRFVSPSRLTCRYTAAEVSTSALDIFVTNPDGYCAILTGAFRYVSNVVISPRVQTISTGRAITFSAGGGARPYRFSVIEGGGKIDEKSGAFVAAAEPGTTIVSVADAAGVSAQALVLVVPPLSIQPGSGDIGAGETFRLGALGGVYPYRYQVVSGPGQVDGESGAFSSSEGGETVISVTDSEGSSAQATVRVFPPLTLTPTSVDIAATNTREFKAAGGVPPYRYQVVAGQGTIDGSGDTTAIFTATEQPGDVVVRVEDSLGARMDARVSVRPAMAVYPSSRTVLAGEAIDVLVTGGVPEHTVEQKQGHGRIDEGAVYIAPKRASEDVLEVKDSVGNRVEIALKVIGAGTRLSEVSAATVAAGVKALAAGRTTGDGQAELGSDPVSQMIHSVFSRRLAAGLGHTCAVLGESLKCWGNNKFGQLGDGTTLERRRPTDPSGIRSGVLAVVAGFYHTCALMTGGAVRCWGDNRYGQLGNNSTESSSEPRPVFSLTSGVKAIAAGQFHTCALKGTAVICWGDNRRGQLGDGTRISSSVPLIPAGMGAGVTSIGAGSHHSCALKDGEAYCWGYNRSGQLGTGLIRESFVPIAVQKLEPGGLRALAIDAKGSHSCVLFGSSPGVDTQMKCWGYNGPGNLGDRSTEFRYVPERVADLPSSITAMSLGHTHTCAILGHGQSAKCWGQNVLGQLGDGTATQYRFAPVEVAGLPAGIESIGAGVGHSCALYADSVWCWGSNARGQYGNGSTESARAPRKSFKIKMTPERQ